MYTSEDMLTIYSWNMLYDNKKLDEAFSFVKNSTFDIFCLQEVPEAFLQKLQTLPYSVVYVEELSITSVKRTFPIYCVIISKHPIVHTQSFDFEETVWEVRTKLTRFVLNFLPSERIVSCRARKSFFADISLDGEVIRVFNLHLSLTYPRQRMVEITEAFHNIDTKEVIVCGDFNILDTLYISLFNWLLGGTFSEWLLYKKERKVMSTLWKKHSLKNPLTGTITHPVSCSQLDHILVQEGRRVVGASVSKSRYGSDHCPIKIVLEKRAK